MTAVVTLEAAIDKLEQQKAESTPGDWWSSWGDVFSGPGLSADVCVAPGTRTIQDADLIATLHGTIDAQIGILAAAIEATQAHPLGYTQQAVSAAFTLANAIIGSAS